jgi:hypothetical protein
MNTERKPINRSGFFIGAIKSGEDTLTLLVNTSIFHISKKGGNSDVTI